jgi:methionyl aminopeptidase
MDKSRRANELAAQALAYAGSLVAPGATTDSIDEAVHEFIISHGAYPSPLGYGGFPKSSCTSVNECACHGVPDDRPLEDGDVVSIDISVYLDGFHGDNCRTFTVGQMAPHVQQLVEVS